MVPVVASRFFGLVTLQKAGSKIEEGEMLSSTAITPGTIFMADLTLSLSHWVHTKLSQARYKHLSFELSDSSVMVSPQNLQYWQDRLLIVCQHLLST